MGYDFPIRVRHAYNLSFNTGCGIVPGSGNARGSCRGGGPEVGGSAYAIGPKETFAEPW
jgi:hypothetical protein